MAEGQEIQLIFGFPVAGLATPATYHSNFSGHSRCYRMVKLGMMNIDLP